MGLIPAHADLTPRPKEIPAWESQSKMAKTVYARQAEAVAGYLAHTDHHIGRLLDHARSLPDGDDLVVFYITGDYGASPEGTITGTDNNMLTQNGLTVNLEDQYKVLDELGGPEHEYHYGVPWSWAYTTPFQWMKRVASHYGGTRNSMIVHYPGKLKDPGTVRSQFHHVCDIAPTIYELAKVPAPTTVDGTEQTPLAGISMAYTFSEPDAADKRTAQYFEVEGRRAIYHDGWVAAAMHSVPWELINATGDFDNDRWELYHVAEDYSQAHDLADQHPGKLKELQAVFLEQAKANGVFPLDDRWAQRAVNPERPALTKGVYKFRYAQSASRITEGSAPLVFQRSHSITAELDVTKDETDGVIACMGGETAGYTFYILDGRLCYEYNFFGRDDALTQADQPITPGRHIVRMEYEQAPFRPFVDTTGGSVKLFIDDQQVAEGKTNKMVFARYTLTETLDIGKDLGSTVSRRYADQAPFKFPGVIHYVDYELSPTRPEKPTR